jgi:hypothetical protein
MVINALIGFAVFCFGATVLGICIWRPEIRQRITFILNVLLVFFFPIGTPLAIYAFWKVDKQIPLTPEKGAN